MKMKGCFIFDQKPELIFFSGDECMKKHLRQQIQLIKGEDEYEQSATEPGSGTSFYPSEREFVDPNNIVMVFTPLLTSQLNLMGNLDNPVTSIHSENSMLHALRQYGDYTYVAVSGNRMETEEYLQKKLQVLHRLSTFLYGPVLRRLKCESDAERIVKWSELGRFLDTWALLASYKQSMLVEAIERLDTNKGVAEHCVKVLESLLLHMKSSANVKNIMHAILLVDCKLVAAYSSRGSQQLHSADLLLLAILMRALYPAAGAVACLEESDLTDMFETCLESADSPSEYDSASENDKFHSPTSSPKSGNAPPDKAFTSAVKNTRKLIESSLEKPLSRPSQGGLEDSSTSSRTTASPQVVHVMLQSESCRYLPHVAVCIQVLDAIKLVILCKRSKAKYAECISRSLNILAQLDRQLLLIDCHGNTGSGPNIFSKSTQDALDVAFKQIYSGRKKMPDEERKFTSLWRRWEGCKKNSLFSREPKDNERSMVQSVISKLTEHVEELFTMFFLTTPSASETARYQNGLRVLQTKAATELEAYKDFLEVKCQKNISATPYLEQFPGLVHFIFVDRNTDQLVAPSINILGRHLDDDGTCLLKHKLLQTIVKLVQTCKRQLQRGTTTYMWREGDFAFTYMLWFEDIRGHRLHATAVPELPQKLPGGILAGDFYSRFTAQCFPDRQASTVRCYELHCIHLNLLPTPTIQSQCRRLSELVYEQFCSSNGLLHDI